MRTKSLGYACLFALLLSKSSVAFGDPHDFGGWGERMRGRGDLTPPNCQIDVPTMADSPFSVLWNCADDVTKDNDIRTELWIYKKDSSIGEASKRFLGFPAAVFINEALLGLGEQQSFKDGLPLGVRLVATDKAGNTSISPIITINEKTNLVNQCSLSIKQQLTNTEKTLNVFVKNALVKSAKLAENSFVITAKESVGAEPCEIEELCSYEKNIRFIAQVNIDDAEKATGKLSVSPGNLTLLTSTTTATVENGDLLSNEINGTIDFGGFPTEISLNCLR